jgi:8-oxo-dGTP pyrophosphatase MutT (NUDIX family)
VSLLERIRECNAHDLSDFLPFDVAGQQVGWVKRDFVAYLGAFTEVFSISDRRISLAPSLTDFETRSAALGRVARRLAQDGVVTGWRDELYPVCAAFDAPALFAIERAASVRFGLRSFGVHLMGYVRSGGPGGSGGSGEDMDLWVARRSADKATGPGMKDAFVGGGIAHGADPRQVMIKEAWEEAGVPAALAERAEAVGEVRFAYQSDQGIDFGLDYQYELELPAEFEPVNQDGEVAAFYRWPAGEVLAQIETSSDYFYDANLAFIAFFLRHGLVTPADPDYEAIAAGLIGAAV